MASSSPSFLDRVSPTRQKPPILPLYTSRPKPSDDYDLDDLSPRPDVSLLSESPPLPIMMSTARSPSPLDPWDDDPFGPADTFSKLKPKTMFAGPPPPITASVVLQPSAASGRRGPRRPVRQNEAKGMSSSRLSFGSIMFDHSSRDSSKSRVDSVWRNLRHRERALHREVQRLLDIQATRLGSGAETLDASTGGAETWSDSGSSTPTGTFYSTATSKSRMVASLDPPIRATPRGDIIPVRQPKVHGQQGLRAARSGLRQALAALTGLKTEENAYIESALSQRKKALSYLDKLDKRRASISAELQSLADDEEEPLAKELRTLGEQHDTLGQEIRELEEKLVGMRNRHRWLERKMEDVHNRREAGLSGYRGALKEVEGEVTSLLRRPPIEPLDLDVIEAVSRNETGSGNDVQDLPSGAEFFRMIPTRRTLSMAKDWWESEMDFLHKRKAQVDKDRDALDQGTELWQETVKLVTTFEADLRQSLSGGASLAKGKQTPRAQQEGVEALLPRMAQVILELEANMRLAEQNSWNLLICAVGAELEAFRDAASLLRGSLPKHQVAAAKVDDIEEPWHNGDDQEEQMLQKNVATATTQGHQGESDNEVPPDLLVSHLEEHLEEHDDDHSNVGSIRTSSSRRDSDNEVPPEFLAEHSNDEGID
ncbi:hypothetical protein CORC01_00123 [Colletotrichum orchidophilum]|uniref:Autophagy-related protein 28 n=1 Tax=Colletotrichum orchidophilum TaxID=1209926 RepID=A0A1G4BTA0_9PEZI|nr:uncharacterized protein CORC01_00123 [Colletotrichum orchidophilum]OHF04652.1 hypothetical protein CORC01_00123 [Colletotrichum orchidophilum]